jgi:aryl-alcohol dehydrogenase-like predicted oxidoreductase
MLYRTLGRTGLKVSIAGLGTGGASKLGQNTGRTRAESRRVVKKALDLGINVFDSSPSYGESEALLGEALEGVPRDRYVLATKFQPKADDGLHKDPKALTEQLEQSLRRLRVDTIDVLQYHGVGPEMYRQVVDRFHPVALRAQEAGKVRFLGITETVSGDPRHEMLQTALQEDLFDTFMVKYGILNQRAAEEVLPLAREKNLGVFVMAAVRTSLRNPQEAVATINQFIDDRVLSIPRPSEEDPLGLGKVTEGEIPSVTEAAYQFAAAPDVVSTVLIGTGNSQHLETNVADLLSSPLSEAQRGHLKETYGHLAWNA